MAIILFDNNLRKQLYPISNTCAVADIRIGILTMKERWEKMTGEPVFVSTAAYLKPLYKGLPIDEHLWIDASILPSKELATQIMALRSWQALADEKNLIACRGSLKDFSGDTAQLPEGFSVNPIAGVEKINFAWDIFYANEKMIRFDFELITRNKESEELPAHVLRHGQHSLFIEAGTKLEYCTINTTDGPVYIGAGATVMDGAFLRGPLALCHDSVVKMGAKIYGGTTVGPYCVGGGEIKNSVMQSYSNKAHDGYMGDAVVGSWCNLGAGTSNSNVKNTAGPVKIWNAAEHAYIETQVKCGMVVGSYTRTAINTSINTGSVIGTCCNIFGEGFPPKYVPDFQWGGKGLTRYELEKSFADINNWQKMKGKTLSDAEKQVLKYIFEAT